jgi:hypothetical protein
MISRSCGNTDSLDFSAVKIFTQAQKSIRQILGVLEKRSLLTQSKLSLLDRKRQFYVRQDIPVGIDASNGCGVIACINSDKKLLHITPHSR